MDRFLSLSFVTKRPGRWGGLNYWDVTRVEDHHEQWRQGELLALEALAFIAKNFSLAHDLLLDVALDMPRPGELTPVERGFMRTIGAFAVRAHRRFGDGFFRKHMAEMDAGNERGLAMMAAALAAARSEAAKRGARTREANKAKRKRKTA